MATSHFECNSSNMLAILKETRKSPARPPLPQDLASLLFCWPKNPKPVVDQLGLSWIQGAPAIFKSVTMMLNNSLHRTWWCRTKQPGRKKRPGGSEEALKTRIIIVINDEVTELHTACQSPGGKPNVTHNIYVMTKPTNINISPVEHSNKHICMDAFGQREREGGYVQLWMDREPQPL